MKPFTPQLTYIPKRTVLSITAVGSPQNVFSQVMPALYGTAYGTKFKVFKPKKKIMTVGQLVSLYPDATRKPKSKWTIVCELEVSPFVKTKDLIQKDPKRPVSVVHHPAAQYAEILHIGTYASETPTIQKLLDFIKSEKLRIVGPHEEVYLSHPGPKARTIIRHAVRRKKGKLS